MITLTNEKMGRPDWAQPTAQNAAACNTPSLRVGPPDGGVAKNGGGGAGRRKKILVMLRKISGT